MTVRMILLQDGRWSLAHLLLDDWLLFFNMYDIKLHCQSNSDKWKRSLRYMIYWQESNSRVISPCSTGSAIFYPLSISVRISAANRHSQHKTTGSWLFLHVCLHNSKQKESRYYSKYLQTTSLSEAGLVHYCSRVATTTGLSGRAGRLCICAQGWANAGAPEREGSVEGIGSLHRKASIKHKLAKKENYEDSFEIS